MRSDLVGLRSGRLLVVSKTDKRGPDGSVVYECACDCGNICFVSRNRLTIKGHSRKQSCGCLHDETHKPHGMSKTIIYHKWVGMKDRCYNKKSKQYNDYGGRGITVCADWLNDFLSFYKWSIENGYKIGLSIDRIDVNKGYSPDNCRWITMPEQQRNKRNVKIISWNGESHTIPEWSNILGIKYGTLWKRIKNGVPVEKAFSVK